MSNETETAFLTRLVHAGERMGPPAGQPVSTPIYASSTFTYESMEEVDRVFGGEKQGYVYTRYGNPTLAALEESVRVSEEGQAACSFASGMAAVHAAIFACELGPGDVILASQDIYGATTDLLYKVFGSFGIKIISFDFQDLEGLRQKARDTKPRVLIAETISNPLLRVCDIEACAEIAREVRARLIIDNTFASPFLCQPLKLGASFSVHSATKYLAGHADAMGGVVVVSDATDAPGLISIMKLAGGILGVWDAHQILRGVKTLGLRLERQCANAAFLANELKDHPQVSAVFYPSNESATRELIKRQFRMDAGGALVSIEIKAQTKDAAFRFMDALKLCIRSTSLGDVFSSVLHPATASHRDVAPARRRQLGISDGVVRISVGIEDAKDILADIQQALGKV